MADFAGKDFWQAAENKRWLWLEMRRGRRQGFGVKQAFILGAGLGTRLRPLTSQLPKPLVPLFHKPLAWWAIEACQAIGISRFAVNTHHLPECWEPYRDAGTDLSLFHEPVLLETGGGLKNIEAWIGEEPVLVHNGDIYSSMPLARLVAAHGASGRAVTLALRSQGQAKHIALDASGGLVTDIRGMLGRAEGTHVFSGIYCVNPDFLGLLPPREKVSVIPAFLELARRGDLGAVVIDEGEWLDLGDREAYLQAHARLALAPAIHPLAKVHPEARIENSVIGPGAQVGAGASIRNSVLWPDARVEAGADLERCIVYSGLPVSASHCGADL